MLLSSRTSRTALVLVPLLGLGCATAINGPRQAITFASEPEGAAVSVDGVSIGTTPARVAVSRKGPHVLVFTKDGYRPQTVHVDASYQGFWIPINALWGGAALVGSILINDSSWDTWNVIPGAAFPLAVLVDHVVGAPRALDRQNVHVQLVRAEPASFYRTMEPSWSAIELREDVADADAWEKLRDILVRRFDIEVIEKSDGYLRTGWLYTWTGEYRADYRVRVTVKCRFADRKVEVKTEAQYGREGEWAQGYDTELLALIKTDMMGAIGTVTR